jgi:hypothetical protein
MMSGWQRITLPNITNGSRRLVSFEILLVIRHVRSRHSSQAADQHLHPPANLVGALLVEQIQSVAFGQSVWQRGLIVLGEQSIDRECRHAGTCRVRRPVTH